MELIKPAMAPEVRAYYNKTGSSNGFATYAIFIPEEKIAIVMLSNKWIPIPQRITATYQLLEKIER